MASGPITSWEIDGETVETVSDFILGGSKITADGDCSHEIKRCLLLGRKVMTNLDSIFKSRDITLPTKVRLVKAMVFPVVMYGCESWTVKKAERQRIHTFEHQLVFKLVMPSNHLIICRPLLLLPSIFPSHRVFSNESVLCIRWPKYWSFSFSISSTMNIQDCCALGWIGWISLQSKGLSRVFFNTTVQKHQLSLWSNSHIHT